MATTTTTASAADHLDPWGFGRCDDAGAVVEHTHHAAAPITLAALAAHDARDSEPAFPPFAERHAARSTTKVRAETREWLAVFAVFAFAVLGQAFYIGYRLSSDAAGAPSGTIVISSHPPGLQVFLDGRLEGTTPLALTARPGVHRVEVAEPSGTVHAFDADVVAGGRWAQHVVAPGLVPADLAGSIEIAAADASAKVIVDGELVGTAPIAPRPVAPGDHVVRLEYANGRVLERRVAIAAGARLSLIVETPGRREATAPAPAALVRGPMAVSPATARTAAVTASMPPATATRASASPAGSVGWARVESPFEVEIYERGRLLGSSGLGRVSLPAGGHALELVNEALGYRVVTKAVVLAGKTVTVPVETPRAVVHVNAQPWAEVLVDGAVLGETPLANVMLPIGHHQLVFRHPELGERTQAFTVRAGGPNRVSADLRR